MTVLDRRSCACFLVFMIADLMLSTSLLFTTTGTWSVVPSAEAAGVVLATTTIDAALSAFAGDVSCCSVYGAAHLEVHFTCSSRITGASVSLRVEYEAQESDEDCQTEKNAKEQEVA